MTERFKIIMLVLITFLLPVDLIDAGEKLLFKLVSSLLDYIRFIMIFVIYIMLCFWIRVKYTVKHGNNEAPGTGDFASL